MTNTSLGTRRDADTEDHVLSLRVVETVLPELRVEEGCQRGNEAQGDMEAAITGLLQSILKSKTSFPGSTNHSDAVNLNRAVDKGNNRR